MPAVYLIHFSRPLGHARHYVGWAKDPVKRLKVHRAGRGARITRAAVAVGITLSLARVWPGTDRHFERYLKARQKNAPRLCPVCNPPSPQPPGS